MKINELLKRSTPFRSCFAAALPASIILILGANDLIILPVWQQLEQRLLRVLIVPPPPAEPLLQKLRLHLGRFELFF